MANTKNITKNLINLKESTNYKKTMKMLQILKHTLQMNQRITLKMSQHKVQIANKMIYMSLMTKAKHHKYSNH